MNVCKYIKKHFNNFLPQVSQWFFHCKIHLGVRQCLPHFQSIKNRFHHPPLKPSISSELATFCLLVKELLWDWLSSNVLQFLALEPQRYSKHTSQLTTNATLTIFPDVSELQCWLPKTWSELNRIAKIN